MTRDQEWEIVCEFVQPKGLWKHMLAVETCLSANAHRHANGRRFRHPAPTSSQNGCPQTFR